MQPQVDEKKRAVTAILDCMRLYNPRIGTYEKSIYTEDFDYSVKLSNGQIRIPEEIIQDFEKSRLLVTEGVYGSLAKRFISNDLAHETDVIPKNTTADLNTEREPKSLFLNHWKIISAIIICLALGLYWYSNARKTEETAIAGELAEKEHRILATRDSMRKEQERVKQEQQKAIARINIYEQVSEENNSYHANQFWGGISGLKITVANNSDYTVDMVKVRVNYIKASGGRYKEEYIYFNKISPHSSVTEDAPDSSRGTSVTIERVSLTCAELDLY